MNLSRRNGSAPPGKIPDHIVLRKLLPSLGSNFASFLSFAECEIDLCAEPREFGIERIYFHPTP